MPMRSVVLMALSWSLVWLAGCQHVPPGAASSTPDLGPEASLDVSSLEAPAHSLPLDDRATASERLWEGRMSVKLDAHAGRAAEGISLAFALRMRGTDGELSLMTPMGTQMARVQWNPHQAVLQDSDGEQRFSSLEALCEHLLGEVLPLHALPHWLDGRPDPDQHSTPVPELEGFEQAAWQVDLRGRPQDLIVARRPASADQRGIQMRVRLLR